MDYKVRDGDVVELLDHSLWVVSWNIHKIPDSIIALPYYVFRDGKRTLIESPMDSIEYARRKYPYLTTVVESYDRILPLISTRLIRRIFYSNAYLRNEILPNSSIFSRLVRELISLIASEAEITVDDLGVSFIPSEIVFPRKVYIIAYNEEVGFKVYNALRRLFFTTTLFEHLKGDHVLSTMRKYGIYVKISPKTLDYIYSRKVLSGIFRGKIEYHVKILRSKVYSFGDIKVQNLGRVLVLAKVLDDKFSLLTPAEYDIQVVDVAEGDFKAKFASKIVVYNEGYKEHLWKGVTALVHGRLEKVWNIIEDKEHYRISVGLSRDILLPTRRLYAPLEP